MTLAIAILLAVGGIALVIWGADKLTSGAVGVAERMRIPQMTIGLTIVAMGTSAPELFVSLMSAIGGTPDLAVGNIVGSNIFNVMVITGITALVAPMVISKTTVRRDLPIAMVSSMALMAICADGHVGRLESAALLAAFIAFMVYTVRTAGKGRAEDERPTAPMAIWKSILFIVIGLACLIGGSHIFVDGATTIARALGVSDAVIGLTIVAGGTSLPELATSVVAARKGNSSIAIGNVIGSNVFNILMIIGVTGVICPMRIEGVTMVDMGVMVISSFMLWTFSYTRLTVERWEGAVLVGGYAAYLWWLIGQI